MKNPVFTHSSTIALLGAMGLSMEAAAIPFVPATCPAVFNEQLSFVLDAVEDNGDGSFDYGYRVCNNDAGGLTGVDFIRDWELPFFAINLDGDLNGGFDYGDYDGAVTENESGITNIMVPEGWSWAIETIGEVNPFTGYDGSARWQEDGDPMKIFFDNFFGGEALNPYNDVEQVLHFYTGECFEADNDQGFECGSNFLNAEIAPPGGAGDVNSLFGFGFTGDFAATNAPYQASWVENPPRSGDPAFPLVGPSNPTINAALPDPNNPPDPVPAPGALSLLGVGLGLLAARLRRRKRD